MIYAVLEIVLIKFNQLSYSWLQVIEKPNAVYLDSIKAGVDFCGISFKYGDNMPLVLNGLDLHIDAGETVAIVGPSGGGKTTLIKLLLRLYDPLRGELHSKVLIAYGLI